MAQQGCTPKRWRNRTCNRITKSRLQVRSSQTALSFEALWPSNRAILPFSYFKVPRSGTHPPEQPLTSSLQWHTFKTAFIHSFFSPANLHASSFKPILMFSLALLVPTLGKKKAHFLLVPSSPAEGTKSVPKFKQHLGQCEGCREQEVDQCCSQGNTNQCVGENCGVTDLIGK